MGQYQKHFYGSTLYGKMNAFYGQYTTAIFDAQEKFTAPMDAVLTCKLPYSVYKPNTYETTLNQYWTVSSTTKRAVSTNIAATATFNATGRSFQVSFLLQKTGTQTVRLVLKKLDGTVVQTKDESTYSLTQTGLKNVLFNDVPFDMYVIDVSIVDGDIPFTLDSFKVLTADVGVEVQSLASNTGWTSATWVKTTPTYTYDSKTDTWKIKATSVSSFSGTRYSRARLTLITSEETTAPVVDVIELMAGNSNLRAQNGTWTAALNMNSIASASSKSFKKTNKITWTSTEPTNSSLVIRSSSSQTGDFYGAITAPYRKNTKRLRLKKGILRHSVSIGPINPAKANWKINSWKQWADISFLPKDGNEVVVTYLFSKALTGKRDAGNFLQEITKPMSVEDKSLKFSPQPFYFTIEMERTTLKGTPVVDLVDLYSEIQYKQVSAIESKDISAVENNNTGKKVLQKISDTTFQEPATTNENTYNTASISGVPTTYILENRTNRPNDVSIYLKSEENSSDRTNQTTNKATEIWAKASAQAPELGVKTGVLKHYQYSGGNVQYLKPHSHEMNPTFTPSLNQSKAYRYYLVNGWPQETHVVMSGQTLTDVANMYGVTVTELKASNPKIQYAKDGSLAEKQQLKIPNKSLNANVKLTFSNGTVLTEKSSHNARLRGEADLSSDIVKAEIPTSPSFNYVEWVSEEKIYDGVINHNDIRGAYIRTQYNHSEASSLERTYTIQSGDSWTSIAKKFDISEDDLRVANPDANMWTGVTIIIPPNILLPEIANGVEFENGNPYEVTIVNNSVMKADGTTIDESWIPVDWNGKHLPLTATYKVSDPVTIEVVRGDIANDMDPLAHGRITNIIRVEKTTGISYQKWDEDLKIGDYKLNNDYIDWSPAAGTSKEPAKGETYRVTYTYLEVDKATVHLDTTYEEETGVDNVWRSTEIKVLDGICSPNQDALIALPAMNTFEGFGERGVIDYGYIVEDNDLWVETSIVEVNNQKYILGSLKNRNPRENWFPLITPGFYYLKEDEYYLYSETLATKLEEKDIPVAKNIEYEHTDSDMGILIEPKSSNMVSNSTMENKDWKRAATFTFKTV